MQQEPFDLFKDPDYGVSRSRDILTSLWRQMLRDLNIGPLAISDKMSAFMKNPRNKQLMRGRSMQSLRGNMRKELLKKDHLSWRWFERGIYLLAPKAATFQVILEWPSGEKTVHQRTITLQQHDMEEFEDDDQAPG